MNKTQINKVKTLINKAVRKHGGKVIHITDGGHLMFSDGRYIIKLTPEESKNFEIDKSESSLEKMWNNAHSCTNYATLRSYDIKQIRKLNQNKDVYKFIFNDKEYILDPVLFLDVYTVLGKNMQLFVPVGEYSPMYVKSELGEGYILPLRPKYK